MVNGRGSRFSRAMIVGEAPGKTEVRLGAPFVGRAGEQLNNALKALGVDCQPYIVNAYRELPLNGQKIRAPLKEEIRSHEHLLREDILEIDPWAILALGAVATWALTRWDGRMEDVRGKVVTTPGGRLVVPVWHPAYLLRNDWKFDQWLADIEPWWTLIRMERGDWRENA